MLKKKIYQIMSLYATEINNLLTQFKDENNMVEYYVIK